MILLSEDSLIIGRRRSASEIEKRHFSPSGSRNKSMESMESMEFTEPMERIATLASAALAKPSKIFVLFFKRSEHNIHILCQQACTRMHETCLES